MIREAHIRDIAAIALLAVLTGAGAMIMGRALPFLQVAENWTADVRLGLLSTPEPQSESVVIAAITEETLASLPYRSPVDRDFLARLIGHLEQAGARAIGLDILFDQPTEPSKDRRLRDTLLGASIPLVVATADVDARLTNAQQQFLDRYLEGIGTGYANLVKNRWDGTVRRHFGGKAKDGTFIPGFAAALAGKVGGRPPNESERIRYHARADSKTPPFRVYPAHLVATLPPAWFQGKVVLLGSDLPLIDRHRTPFAVTAGGEGMLPGVLVHAHALSQLLDGTSLTEPGPTTKALIALLLAAVGGGLALWNLSIVFRFVLFGGIVVLYWAGGGVWFRLDGTLVPLVVPTLALAISAAGGTAYLGHRDWKQKRFIREAFSRYLSPAMVQKLVDDPSQLKVGGERRELTYLFTDIAGFTSLSERHEPSVLVPVLNEYIDGMCKTALEHGATLDKIIGDAMVCFFNAPVAQPDHRERAVACALALDAFSQAFIQKQAAPGIEMGITRIGVHSGVATIGNFGGDEFFDYTAFGDMVNTAARLESVNKHLGTRICIGAETANGCPDQAFRPVGTLTLKGKSEGIAVLEPVPETDEPYMAAYEKMRRGAADAVDAFASIVAADPNDKLAAFHLKRLEAGEKGDTIVMREK